MAEFLHEKHIQFYESFLFTHDFVYFLTQDGTRKMA